MPYTHPEITPALQEHESKARASVEQVCRWFEENLQILTKNNEQIPLVPNVQQREILKWVAMQQSMGQPVRIIVLKARRMGVSTLITALGTMFAILWPAYRAFACAHDQAGTDTLRDMARLFQDELSPKWRRGVRYDSRFGLIFKRPHHSRYEFRTAGTKTIGRTKEITYLHISEQAHIRDFATVASGLMSCIPRMNPRSCVFRESTANGEADSGQFHRVWLDAVAHRRQRPNSLDGYIPLFFSWLDFPEYRIKIPDDYEWGSLDEHEHRLKVLGADEEQLYFRRVTIAEDYAGDPDTFSQEYPATPEEAFRSSGRPAIPANIVDYHESLIRPPKRYVRLHWRGKEIVAADTDPSTECWRVWFDPVPEDEADYIIAGDVAEGKLSDPADDKSKPDYHAGIALNRRYLRVDATWMGRRMGADVWGQELLKCATWYNRAWASPEANSAGQAALVAFKDYDRVCPRKPGEPVAPIEERELPMIGFKTLGGPGGNRDYMIDMFIAAASDSELTRRRAGFRQRLQLYDERIVEQEKTFVRKKDGKREHQAGSFDDLLLGLFIALQLHLNCPRTVVNTQPEFKRIVLDSRWAGGFAGPEDDEKEVTYDTLETT